MAFRIGPALDTLPVHRFLDKSQREMEQSLSALASGSRIVKAADDAAGFAISESLRGHIASSKQARFNAQNAQALIQTAEGGLNEQANIVIRLRELAVQSASDTIGDEERGFIDKEFQLLVSEFDRIAQSTRFGNKDLLTGSGENFEFHVGPNADEHNIIRFTLDANTSASNVGISDLGISDQDDAKSTLQDLDEAQLKIAEVRSGLGAVQGRFTYTIDHLTSQHENLSNAKSLITDVDVAEEVSKLTRSKIIQEFGVAVTAQANAMPMSALKLLNTI